MLLFLKIKETQNKPKGIDLMLLWHDIFLILRLFKKMSRLLPNIEHSYAFP